MICRINPLSLVLMAMIVLEKFDKSEEAVTFIEKVRHVIVAAPEICLLYSTVNPRDRGKENVVTD